MTETLAHPLPHGITLNCRVSGERGRPVLMFLHGFPEAAFVWDPLLAHFSRPENGGYRCVAPNLRGYEQSSAPSDVSAYRAKHLVQDILALCEAESPHQPLAALVAHDWGGAVAWGFANQHPGRLRQLAIINSPHPGTFLRELQNSPEQQAASPAGRGRLSAALAVFHQHGRGRRAACLAHRRGQRPVPCGVVPGPHRRAQLLPRLPLAATAS